MKRRFGSLFSIALIASIASATPAFSQTKGDGRLPPLDPEPPKPANALPPMTPPPPIPSVPVKPAANVAPKSDAERVAELKRKGNAAIDGRLHADALAFYREAYAISKDPALLYNQGRALAGMGQYPEALDAFKEFRAAAAPELLAQVSGLTEFTESLQKKIGTVEIRVLNVAKYEVRVKDERGERSVPENSPIRLNPGEKTFFITAKGHAETSRKVTIVGGLTSYLDVRLARLDRATLSIASETLGAIAFVDGQRLGNVPVDTEVTPGSHEVRLEKEGYEPGQTIILVTAGDKRDLSIPLNKSGILTKWWFWTAVGAVVIAGAGVTFYAATTTRDYDSGTICPPAPQPCRVSTALWNF